MIYWVVLVAVAIMVMIVFLRKMRQQFPVLMYHKVCADGETDDFTISVFMLERQLDYLKKEGYNTILLSQLVNYFLHQIPLPKKPILLTFDDGYKDNYTHLYPLLQQYGFSANIFLVASFIQQLKEAIEQPNQYLSLDEIRSINPAVIEFGLHSFDHTSYKKLSMPELKQDLDSSKALLTDLGVAFQPCVAFPYGAFPKRNFRRRTDFFKTIADNKIQLAFRIGNRLNALPFKNPLLIQRLDIKGNMPFNKFTRLLRFGKSTLL